MEEKERRSYPGRPDPQNIATGDTPQMPTTPIEGSVIGNENAIHDEAPAKEAIEEKNDRPAANLIMWAILIAVIIMAIIYFFVFYGRDVVSSAS